MTALMTDELKAAVLLNVKEALSEDIGSGDITAQLISPEVLMRAEVISRESAIICGRPWADEVFHQVDPSLTVQWNVKEGASVAPNQTLFAVSGCAQSILTAERTALNFLQLLSGVATQCHAFSSMVKEFDVQVIDTRKTIPGLRLAQKYAVTQGGCFNHRKGLYDVFLIKENHINAYGSISDVIEKARIHAPEKLVEIEVESIEELQQALDSNVDIIMLDNFSIDAMRKAVLLAKGKVKLEASGNINKEVLLSIAETGVNFISIGALTKNIKAIDLSMRFIN